MKAAESVSESRDLLCNRAVTSAVFWLPSLALIISSAAGANPILRTAIWVAALTTMGAGCVVNARRCGRVHCYFTGPFFLAMAIVTLLYGSGIARLGTHGWSMISLGLVIGTLILCCLPEAFFGRYVQKHGA